MSQERTGPVTRAELVDHDSESLFSWRISHQVLALAPGTLFMAAFTIRAAFAPNVEGLRFTLFDDAMISMTYARTLAETGEWVWFPGADRVQGFTNPLWTLFMALVHTVGLEGSSAALAVSLTGITVLLLAGVVVGYLVSLALGSRSPGPWAALIAGGTVPFIYPLVYWTLRGMEVGLLALLAIISTLAGWAVTQRRENENLSITWPFIALVVAGATGIAVRLDFVVILGPLLLLSLLWAPNKRARLILLVVVGIPIVTTFFAILAFQFEYWGDLLPNTYRLKVEGFNTGERLSRGLAATAKALPLLLLAGISLRTVVALQGSLQLRRLSVLLAVVGTAPIPYSVWTGGDAWDNFQMLNRYVSVGIPALIGLFFLAAGLYLQQSHKDLIGRPLNVVVLLIAVSAPGAAVLTNPIGISRPGLLVAVVTLTLALLLLQLSLLRHKQATRRNAKSIHSLLALSLVAIAATSSYSGAVWLIGNGQNTAADQQQTDIGLAVKQVTSPEAVIATHWAGAPAYHAQRPMIDLLGKSDRVIANGPPAIGADGYRVAFFPGHSKYDAQYSVESLMPDIVLGVPWDVEESQMSAWGYQRQCTANGSALYVLSSSSKIRWEKVRDCSPDTPNT